MLPPCLCETLQSSTFHALFRRRAEHVPLLFTPRFLRCLVNSLAHADAHLHAAAKRLTEQVCQSREKYVK